MHQSHAHLLGDCSAQQGGLLGQSLHLTLSVQAEGMGAPLQPPGRQRHPSHSHWDGPQSLHEVLNLGGAVGPCLTVRG